MRSLQPLVTAHPMTGAFRSITPDLLAETYLAPRHEPFDLHAALADEYQPWSASIAVAPNETASAVSAALRALALATQRLSPDEIDLSGLDQDSRLYRHLVALCDLWRQAPAALPEDLQIYAHVLRSAPTDALESLQLVADAPCDFAAPIERRLHEHLLVHHGLAAPELRQESAARQASKGTGGAAGTSLWRVQQGLIGGTVQPAPLDETLNFFALRDEAEEADFAAARAQALIQSGISPSDIALLVPDEVGYYMQTHRAFLAAGVPLSGLPDMPVKRDLAGETLLHLLLCLQSPSPAMALASLYISPLMPWPPETGLALAREVMQGRYDPYAAKSLTGRAKQLYGLLRKSIPQTPAEILAALDQVAQCLSDASGLREDLAGFRKKLGTVRAILSRAGSLDWQALFRAATPDSVRPKASEAFLEGVSVFTESSLPWRPARHLIALGMSGNRWPRAVSASPLFLDGELQILRARTGLQVEMRGETLARRLEQLRRQFLSATESLTLLRPSFSPVGSRQSPSPALSLIARTIGDAGKGTEDAETLIHDLRGLPPERWPFAHRKIAVKTDNPLDALPTDGVLRLGQDLLRRRVAEDGGMRPQSPSRLETLLVSPLAWSLSEFGAEPITWAPDGLNVMVAGTIAHEVLEHLFPKDTPLPDRGAIEQAIPNLLFEAIRKHAPFLQRSIWAVERAGLERDIRIAAVVWRETLQALGARVIDNEIDLRGEALGIRLRGRADCLLQLKNGDLLVVDHKKSGTTRRRARLDAGWDLQLGLYRAMLMRPDTVGTVLEAALANKPRIGVAYHLINDQGVLLEGLEAPDGVAIVMPPGISDNAIAHLETRLAEVGTGDIRLNCVDDREFFEKTAALAPNALKASPLVELFMMPGANPADSLENDDD